MMYDSIKNFNQQFLFEPKIENKACLGKYGYFVIAGMGGSGLAAELLLTYDPALPVIIHKDYGLPEIAIRDRKKTLVIVDSYSGNTEEALDAFRTARARGFPLAAISIGGKLLDLARKYNVPYVQMPDIGIQPRMGLGFNFGALLKIIRKEQALAATNKLYNFINASFYRTKGIVLAKKLRKNVPIIYASMRNRAIGYAWKIKLNETGKIPAFANVLPELNHNEMNGFDSVSKTRELSSNFHFIFLKDTKDHPRIQLRMKVLEKLYRSRKLPVEIVQLAGRNRAHAVFSSLLLADWTALFLAEYYGVEPEQVPMVEEFKILISE
ncbi:MAG: hypothetical protein HYT98_02390 [Candidatus Sungbacteria bacterium]|nr:hypothetical protein [Candidatus Sungbacteria bacterium]